VGRSLPLGVVLMAGAESLEELARAVQFRFEHVLRPPGGHEAGGAGQQVLPYGDEKVANREIRVWHFVIENGY
jgi:hypothetical protein